jgi:hypothetical protein
MNFTLSTFFAYPLYATRYKLLMILPKTGENATKILILFGLRFALRQADLDEYAIFLRSIVT